MENEEEIVFLEETNDNSNDNSNTHINRPEKATNTKANTVPANETQKDKNKDEEEDEGEDKNKAEDSQGTENEVPDGLDAKNKNKDNQKSYSNNGTEEATTMGADMKAISVEILGLQKHAKSFHAKGAAVAAAKHTEEENMPAEVTDAKNSEELAAGTVSVQETEIQDGWHYKNIKADDETNGKGENTEEEADDDEKAGDTEDDSKTTSTIGE